jgi:hypothetical protein
MASPSKKRKSGDSCWVLNEKKTNLYFFVPIDDKSVCLICRESGSGSKEYNIKGHYETRHTFNSRAASCEESEPSPI